MAIHVSRLVWPCCWISYGQKWTIETTSGIKAAEKVGGLCHAQSRVIVRAICSIDPFIDIWPLKLRFASDDWMFLFQSRGGKISAGEVSPGVQREERKVKLPTKKFDTNPDHLVIRHNLDSFCLFMMPKSVVSVDKIMTSRFHCVLDVLHIQYVRETNGSCLVNDTADVSSPNEQDRMRYENRKNRLWGLLRYDFQ